MKKIAAIVGAAALLAIPATASAGNGNAYGKNAGDCVAALGLNLGQAIQAGKAAHPTVKMTPAAIAASIHCAA